MRIKVDGGTPRHDADSLCDTCRWSRIIRGRTLDEEVVHCDASHMMPMRVTFKVTSCSDYADTRLPSYHELMEQAWILRPATKRRPAGFVRGRDLTYEERMRVISDGHDRDR
ncbi:MAG TPA: hypothetical protein VFA27_15905 [Vicinamibacterales bacterium]|nr:hypothetical protein [Vicinamibacterales bacterium]